VKAPVSNGELSVEADLSWHFAHMAAGVDFSQVTPDAVTAAKQTVLDTLGVCLAASGLEPAVGSLIDTVREVGGTPQASILGFAESAPALMAAFANGALAHALDFDDLTPWGQHAGSSVMPAVWAMSQRQGGVHGRDFLAAVAAGQDIFARMRRHVVWSKNWNLGSVFGVYAGAAAAARVAGMSSEQIQSAMGIATQQSSGLMEIITGPGGDFRGCYAAFSAKGALLAAILAQRGLTCVERPFEGTFGVFANYFAGGYERTGMLAGLGTDFQGSTTLYKRWPSVGTSHSHVHAVLTLMEEHHVDPRDVEEILVYVGDYHRLMCTPLDQRQAPQTLVDARFSLPFLVAAAAVNGGLSVHHFTIEGLNDPRVIAMARRVRPVEDSAYDWEVDLPPGRVELRLSDGRALGRVGLEVPGSPEAPMTWQMIEAKFRECAAVAARPPSSQQVDSVIEMVHDLENLENATDVLAALSVDTQVLPAR